MGNIVAFLFFGVFAFIGAYSFYEFGISAVVFLLQNGYWQKPPTETLFGLVFVISHGGIGFGGLCYLIFIKDKDTLNPEAPIESPWLRRSYWSNSTIYPDSKSKIQIINFIFYYLAFLSPLILLAVFESVRLQQYTGLFGLLVPTIASWAFFYKNKLRQQIAIHGKMPLQMNPFPGSIGGHVGGSIEVHLNRDNQLKSANIKLQCLQHDRNSENTQKEQLWDETMIPLQRSTLDGKELQFSFTIDAEQEQSQAKENSQYIEWQLSLELDFENGQKLKKNYCNLPVFNTAKQSNFIDQQAYAQGSSETLKMNNSALDKIMPLTSTDQSYQFNYSIGRNFLGLFLVIFGVIFIVVGLNIPDLIFNIFFPFLGGLAALGGIYSFFNSLEVHIDPTKIKTKRYLFGILIKTFDIPSYELEKFELKKSGTTTSSQNTTHHYEILAISQNQQKTVVIENIKSRSQARLAIERLEKILASNTNTPN